MQTVIQFTPVNVEARKKIGLRAGDTVRVWQKIEEKGKTRTQAFEGLVLSRKHGGEPGATFTVRRVLSGAGVEKVFPLYSPLIDKIEILKRARVRRAKLYYVRDKATREIKRQMRRGRLEYLATESEQEVKVRVAKEEEEKAKAVAVIAKTVEIEEDGEKSKETEADP